MTTHEVLVKAKAYLLEHGWTQNSYGAHGGPRCIYGALRSAYGVETDIDSMGAIFALGDQVGNYSIANWNDEDVRTFEQVIDAFDKAIIATAPEAKPEDALTAQETIDALSPLAFIPGEALA